MKAFIRLGALFFNRKNCFVDQRNTTKKILERISSKVFITMKKQHGFLRHFTAHYRLANTYSAFLAPFFEDSAIIPFVYIFHLQFLLNFFV